jgi:hypothetical protein
MSAPRASGLAAAMGTIWITLACSSWAQQNPAPGPPAADFATSDRLVLAYHYPWYGYKEPKNWDEQEAIADHPLLGAYRSDDPKLIDFQFSLAREAGIDGFLVSWDGPDSTPGAIFAGMLEQLEKGAYGRFRLCVIWEGIAGYKGPGPLSLEKGKASLKYICQQYGRRPGYLRVNGKPVIFVYQAQAWPEDYWRNALDAVRKDVGAAMCIGVPDGWEVDLGLLSLLDGIAPYADKYYTDEALKTSYTKGARLVRPQQKPLIVAAIGGGSRIRKLGFDIDRSQGQYLRRRFQLARELEANWVTITSWNEWYEAMQIEPSREYGFEQIEHVRREAARFHGRSLPPLEGAAMIATQRLAGARTELTVRNIGRRNLYAVTATAGGKKRGLVAYVLHPGETALATLEAACDQVLGFLPDGTAVTTSVTVPPAGYTNKRGEVESTGGKASLFGSIRGKAG